MKTYVDTNHQYEDLNSIGNWIIIRCDDAWGDSISAKRISEDTVDIITTGVHPNNENQGRGTALVQKLFDVLPSDVEQVVLRDNVNPGWWSHIQSRISGGANLVL